MEDLTSLTVWVIYFYWCWISPYDCKPQRDL